MEGADMQPHIQLTRAQMCPVVITVGDPARAARLAAMCEKHEELAYNREYRSFSCTQGGEKFLVVSHGVGASGATVCWEELIENGAKYIMRAGTAGSLHPKLYRQGDLFVVHSAVREEGSTDLLAPKILPAVADMEFFNELMNVAKTKDIKVYEGMAVSSALFYQPTVMPKTLELWQKCNVEIVEMEISALYVLCRLKKIKAGSICCIDGSPFGWGVGDYDPNGGVCDSGKVKMLEIAIETAARLAKKCRVGEAAEQSKENKK